MTPEERQVLINRKSKPVMYQQSMWSTFYDCPDGSEMREQSEMSAPCYRIGESTPTYTDFAELDD